MQVHTTADAESIPFVPIFSISSKRINLLLFVFIFGIFLSELAFPQAVQFTDLALENAIRNEINLASGEISEFALLELKSLEANKSSIGSLTGLEKAVNLEVLSLQGNSITDLTPLQSLTKLEDLDLRENQITDLQALQSLTNLEKLNLSSTPVENLGPISGLQELERLYLQYTLISNDDLELIAGLENLNGLFVSSPNISNYSLVANSTGLLRLNIADSTLNYEEFDHVATNLPDLYYLYLNRNNLTDLSPLSKLSKLRFASFTGNQISDLSPLSGLNELSHLRLDRNKIEDLTPLLNKPNLQQLVITNNQISDISPLVNLPRIHSLNLAHNSIADLAPILQLAEQDKLNYLNISYNLLDVENDASQKETLDNLHNYSFSFLGYPQLLQEATFEDPNLETVVRESLQIPDEKLSIEDLVNLESLDASNRSISNIQGLSNAPNLTHLDLSGNNLTSLEAFYFFPSLESLDLSENQLYLYDSSPIRQQLNVLEDAGITIETASQRDPGFDNWIRLYFSDSDLDLMTPNWSEADSDRDGANNRLEWITRANPADTSDRLCYRAMTEGNLLKIAFLAPRHEDVILSIETSRDFLKWDSSDSKGVEDNQGEMVHTIPLDSSFRAIRIKAERETVP